MAKEFRWDVKRFDGKGWRSFGPYSNRTDAHDVAARLSKPEGHLAQVDEDGVTIATYEGGRKRR